MNLVREAPLLLFDRDISQNFLFETHYFHSKQLFSAENGKSLNQLVFYGVSRQKDVYSYEKSGDILECRQYGGLAESSSRLMVTKRLHILAVTLQCGLHSFQKIA